MIISSSRTSDYQHLATSYIINPNEAVRGYSVLPISFFFVALYLLNYMAETVIHFWSCEVLFARSDLLRTDVVFWFFTKKSMELKHGLSFKNNRPHITPSFDTFTVDMKLFIKAVWTRDKKNKRCELFPFMQLSKRITALADVQQKNPE